MDQTYSSSMDSKKYPLFYKSMDDHDDAQKIEHTRRVRNTVTTRVIERPVPSTSFTSDTRDVLGSSSRQSRTRNIGGLDNRRAQSSSPGPRDVSTVTDDEFPVDENQPPYQSDMKRAQSEGDLVDGDLKLTKLKKIRSFPSLERRVRFGSTDYNMPDDHEDRKRRSKSYDELSWKKPSIEVKRKVQLLPQREPEVRSRLVSKNYLCTLDKNVE